MKQIWFVDWFQPSHYEVDGAMRICFGKNYQTLSLYSEYEFIEQLQNPIEPVPDLVLLEMYLPWHLPDKSMPKRPAANTASGGEERAGLRCLAALRNDPRFVSTPVAFYTRVERNELSDSEQQAVVGVPWITQVTDRAVAAQEITALIHRHNQTCGNSEQPPTATHHIGRIEDGPAGGECTPR